jgi:hypothetical protein
VGLWLVGAEKGNGEELLGRYERENPTGPRKAQRRAAHRAPPRAHPPIRGPRPSRGERTPASSRGRGEQLLLEADGITRSTTHQQVHHQNQPNPPAAPLPVPSPTGLGNPRTPPPPPPPSSSRSPPPPCSPPLPITTHQHPPRRPYPPTDLSRAAAASTRRSLAATARDRPVPFRSSRW